MAHHKTAGKTQWMASQKAERAQLGGDLHGMIEHARAQYNDRIQPLTTSLKEESNILEIGCGAACTAQFVELGHKTYVDPMLDDIRRAYPGELPDGDYITGMAESIPRDDRSFDLILCLNVLSFVHNPELVLHEIKRLLTADGAACISITVWPKIFAQIHYLGLRIFPIGNTPNRLYRYTYQGIHNTLSRHFNIESEHIIADEKGVFSHKTTWLFTCNHK